jgi:hypothetical protein
MLRKLGLPVLALAGALAMMPAPAAARTGVYFGVAPFNDVPYYMPYYSPYYSPYYFYPYNYFYYAPHGHYGHYGHHHR